MMRNNVVKWLVGFALSWMVSSTVAQNLAQHNWYFGNSANGIRFNRSTKIASAVSNQAVPFGTGGSAVVTDPSNANLFFYTDGVRVYDGCHLQMPNGTGLTGNASANQPAVVSPIPGQPNKYFIFTNSANFTTGGVISRTVVDMAQFGNAVFPAPAFGDVENPKNVAVPGLSNRSEGMLVVPHQNGTDYWLITHQNGSQSYSATLINAASYTGAFTTFTTSNVALPTSVASFAYHAASRKLAVAPQDANTDAIIVDFNDATGAILFDRYIYNTAIASTTNQAIYDIEWDAAGQYLYLSRNGQTGVTADVIQYDYVNSNPNTPTTLLSSALKTPVFRSYGLQLAPDSAIYHVYQAASGGPFLVGKFTNTDTVASAVIHTTLPFGNLNFSGTQFPAFIPRANPNITLSFTSAGTCQNSPTSFFPTIAPGADSLNWSFGDGTDTTAWSPIHTYRQASAFSVTLRAFYQGQTQTVTQPVTINPFPLQLQLVADTTACRGEFPPPRGTSAPTQFSVRVQVQGGTPTSFVWSNGDLGQTLTPDSAGYYYVVVSDASGCSAYAGVNVKEYGLQDQRANIWHFGNRAGIDFNVQPARALNISAMDAPEGCAIVCDRNGNAVFYTDGDNVYDRTNVQIDTGIGGDPTSAQSAVIVPVPGDETLFYIFTTQAISGTSLYELRYSLFDLKRNSGRGAITQKNIVLFSKSTERITASSRWLIAHEYGNSSFRAYPVSEAGIGAPVISDIGSEHSFKTQQNGEGYMKLGPRNNLAVVLSTPGVSNLIDFFQFVDSTGVIRNHRLINLNEPNGQIYGVEFSPGGNKLFASVKGSPSPSKIFEYSIDSLNRPAFRQQVTNNNEIGALQVGPDGQVYIALNGQNVLGTIAANEDTTRVSSFNFSGFALRTGTNSRLGLPNFIQQQGNAFGGPGFSFAGSCLGDSTRFTGNATDAIDRFQWSFGDGGSSTQPSPVHLYAAAGTYTVSMRLTNRCGLDTTLVRQVRINPSPAAPTIPPATALCNGPVTLDANSTNISGITYLWSNGATTKTIVISNPALIRVTNTDQNGCTSSAQAFVVDNRPVVDLGLDASICEDNAVNALNAQNPGATYLWRINGVNSSTIQSQFVDTSLPGTFTYDVTVTDPVTGCSIFDQITYTIRVSPAFTFTGTNPTTCGGTNGTVTLQLNPSTPAGGPLYSYFISGPGGVNQQGIDQPAPTTVNLAGPKAAGTYSGIVTDQISGCTISQTIGLTDATFTATAAVSNCLPARVTVSNTGGAAPFTYTFTNSATRQVTGPQVNNNVATLAAGTYTIQVRDNTGCIFSFNQVVNPTVPTVTINSSLCTNPATLTAVLSSGSATAFSWSGPGIVSGATSATVNINAGGAYQVNVTLPGGCVLTQSTTIAFTGVIAPAFTQTTACTNQVTLTATPAGSFTYRWYRNNVFQPGLLGRQIALGLSENGSSYQVEIVDAISGCVVRSAAQTVQVLGPVNASVTSTPPCLDGKPFTLTSVTTATGVNYAWALNNTIISGATSATLSDTRDGTYRVDISKGVCRASASLQITKAPIPVGRLINRAIICNDPDNADPTTASIDLNPGQFTRYAWFKNDLTLNFTNQIYTATSEGMYRVDLTNSFGCVASDEAEILNQCIPKIVAPNAFRPNSAETINRNFFVYSFFITNNFQVVIFNRWGEVVFESKDRDFKWNGGYNNNLGQPLPGGTYAYIIKFVSSFRPDLGVQEQRGGVALVR